ncbi:ATP-binding protein [Streptomyces sp. VRA16 Mangrove soil]|uniref:ATP-binding protein n=1 Tax=Streptomyces sp. VRA16 Mangrove soil TaxID=2817434 RepID=UPI001A9CF60D|nr:ATP-binding protein [Streptomyces sp. VRA16 Mangrove soil]MBO1334134.1 ATP-binding protein [Streptomyces sp. VRA16 Mangrove soil]
MPATTTPTGPVACPPRPDDRPPSPDSLAYSVTLPAALSSPALARAATRAFLTAHRLGDILDPALQAVGELTAAACMFAPGADIYVSLRQRDGALRVTVHDGHPVHANRHLAAACDTRRRAALRLLACVVRACDGDWGFGAAHAPSGGTRMWATLPLAGATAYGAAVPQGE